MRPQSLHPPAFRETSDAAVVGGGPAGAMAALLLARHGWAVTLLEQHRFPREKVCGECISALGMDVLERAGLRQNLLEAGAVQLTHAILHPRAGQQAVLRLPRPMWGLSRGALDALLLDAAGQAGAKVRQPVRCESLSTSHASGPMLRVRDLTSNALETLTPAWVIVADGKGGLCRSRGRPPPSTGDFGIKAHFENVAGARDAIELFSTAGTYGGLAAIEAGRWNAAFSVPAAMLREHKGDVAALFARLAGSSPSLSRRVHGARQIGPWLASPLPRFAVTRRWPVRVIPAGNAAAALEPIGGEGMGLSLRSAELAVEALASFRDDPLAFRPAALARSYRSLWRSRRFGCRAAAIVVTSRIANLAAEMLEHDPRLGWLALRLMGK